MEQQKNKEDLGIKLGSDEMVFWKNILEAQEREIDNIKKSLKFSTWLRDKSKIEYEKAEKEFNSK